MAFFMGGARFGGGVGDTSSPGAFRVAAEFNVGAAAGCGRDGDVPAAGLAMMKLAAVVAGR